MPPISAIPAPDGVPTPDSQAISISNGENLVKIVTLSSPYAATFDLDWSLDREVFAVASSLATRWYRADTLEELGFVKGQYVPSSVALRPDGRAVALGIA
jgi:hypothetical protein